MNWSISSAIRLNEKKKLNVKYKKKIYFFFHYKSILKLKLNHIRIKELIVMFLEKKKKNNFEKSLKKRTFSLFNIIYGTNCKNS